MLSHQITQHSLQQVQILVQHRHGGQPLRRILDACPGLAQVADVFCQLGIAGVLAIGAQNKAATAALLLGAHQLLQARAQCVALVLRNLLRNADMVILRQKHQQTTSNADLRGQACTLGANGVLDDLYQQGLTFKDLLFNRHLGLVLAGKHGGFTALLALPDIGHMQKRSALQSDVDECRLHAWQHSGHLAQIDVTDQPTLQRPLHVQFLHRTALDNRDPRFLRRPVDQNILLH